MGNHRAERRGPGRRPSGQPTPTAGKRKAVRPSRAVRPDESAAEPISPTLLEDESTIVLPLTDAADEPTPTAASATYQSLRVGGVRSAAGPRTGPSKPGARRSASRAPLFRGLPSAPMLLGIAALAVSAGGAVTLSGSLGKESAPRFSQASALSGVSGVSRVATLDRAVVSRDSRRDALDDAAEEKLQDEVEAQSRERSAALANLAKAAERYANSNMWVLPVEGYHLTARFGDYSGLWAHFHTGLDFAADSGTPIHAVASGVVTSVGYDGSYGNKTVITLEDGTELWYCHQTSYVVSVGDQVHAGDLIGYVGSTGNVTGPHLHLEVRPGAGDPVDPYAALVAHGVTP